MNYLGLIIKNPFRNKTRSALAILGIAIGIATIVTLGLITASLEDSTEITLKEGSAEITAMNYGSSSIMSNDNIDEEYVNNLSDITGVNRTAGVLQTTYSGDGSVSIGGGGSPVTTVYGIDSDNLDLMGIESINGTVYSNDSNEVIIGKSFADSDNYTVGDNISLFGEDFKITGIYETGSFLTDSSVYMDLNKLQNLTDDEDKVTQVSVKINNNASLDTVNNEIESEYNGTLTTITTKDMQKTTEDTLDMINFATGAIEALAIIIGGLGVINTMMMTVFERTREIGVLKSVGWTRRRILMMILGESVVLTIISWIIGSIVGTLVVMVLFQVQGGNMTLTYDMWTFVKAFIVALVVGILGGLYPAIKASRLSPTESLRYE